MKVEADRLQRYKLLQGKVENVRPVAAQLGWSAEWDTIDSAPKRKASGKGRQPEVPTIAAIEDEDQVAVTERNTRPRIEFQPLEDIDLGDIDSDDGGVQSLPTPAADPHI